MLSTCYFAIHISRILAHILELKQWIVCKCLCYVLVLMELEFEGNLMLIQNVFALKVEINSVILSRDTRK